MAHRDIRQPALEFAGGSWGEVFHELAEWADTHQSSRDYTVAKLQDEVLPGDSWLALDGLLLDVDLGLQDGDADKYRAILFYG